MTDTDGASVLLDTRSRPDQVSDRIVDLIHSHELRPDAQLPTERELAQRFGVGRSTIREAVSSLAAKGIVEVRHGRGLFVAAPRMRLAVSGDCLTRHKADELIARIFVESPHERDLFTCEFLPQRQDEEEIESQHLEGFDALMLASQRVGTRTVNEAVADRLIAVARMGSGYDNIDLDVCTSANIVVFNSPHGMVHTVALSALTLLLCVGRKALILDQLVRDGRWHERIGHTAADYYQHTLGVIGAGRIGRELIRLLAPFQMRVLIYDPYLPSEAVEALGVQPVPLPALMRDSDFICVACSLTPETTGLVSAEMLALMKPTAFLVNVARGAVVDQEALTLALQERRIAGAALDVFVEEPLAMDDPLTKLDNVVLSPHYAPASSGSSRRTSRDLVKELGAIAHGEIPGDVVNPQVLDRPAFQEKLARWARRS